MLIALAVAAGWALRQIDVKSAFTQVQLPEGKSIWLWPLPGFPYRHGKGLYLELLHYLYGHP